MDICGWVLFTDPARAEEAKADLEADGYRVELQPQEDGAVVVLAIPPGTSPEETLRARLGLVAADLGGEFLGEGGSDQVVLRRHS